MSASAARRARQAALGLTLLTCYDPPERWLENADPLETAAERCTPGQTRCAVDLQHCVTVDEQPQWQVSDRCNDRGLVCSPQLQQCATCDPGARSCAGDQVLQCDTEGTSTTSLETCDTANGIACRSGRCINLCDLAREQKSNVGCEYWAVDLDNAVPGGNLNAAAQQFAVVVSNPQSDVTAEILIERDDSAPNQPAQRVQVAQATIAPLSLRVFPLGPREVDGSPPGQYNTGTHTALTRAGYRLTTSTPVVAFQFNPLENVNVFSNDASLLKPVEALGSRTDSPQLAYVVLGWPQTITRSDDPNTNFSATSPQDFRAFVTIAATRDNTQLRIAPSTRVIDGGPVRDLAPGQTLEVTLNAFDVLNLESDGFNADFTGTTIASTHPVAVFSGGEASDAPQFDRIAERRCCADHLEEQLDPIRTAGRRFVAPVALNRHLALRTAGATLELRREQEVFRVIAMTSAGARLTTSLEPPLDRIVLQERGSLFELLSSRDFWITSDQPIMLGNITPSQSAAEIPANLPGGDPSFILIPPVEQFRSEYVFLTPDRYSFDSLRIVAPTAATIQLDGQPLGEIPGCNLDAASELGQALPQDDFGFVVHRCLLSNPLIDPSLDATQSLQEGEQNDGVHQVRSDFPVGVIVDGFDRNVSYGYAAGTQLEEIAIQ